MAASPGREKGTKSGKPIGWARVDAKIENAIRLAGVELPRCRGTAASVSENRFAIDSLLEGAVTSELVSGPRIPC